MHENLDKKFEKLEKENRKYRIFNTLLSITLFSFLIYGFQQKVKLPDFELPSIIEAEKFILKSEDGKVAEFGLTNKNEASLTFYKENGKKVKLSVGVNNDKAYISIPGENSAKMYISEEVKSASLYLGMDDGERESFLLLDPNNYQPYITLKKGSTGPSNKNDFAYYTPYGSKIIRDSIYMVYGKDFAFNTSNNTNAMVELPGSFGSNVYTVDNVNRKFYFSDGYDPIAKNSYVEVYNPNSGSSTSLKVIQNLPGLVGIKDNKLRYLLLVDDQDKASFKIHDKDAKVRTVIGSESINVSGKQQIKEESNIMFFSKEGNLIEMLPKENK